jgi:predicted HicB family RNase H-like nuclease
MEKLESVPQLSSDKKDQLIVSDQLVHSLNDDKWTRPALFAANEKANLILEDRLVNEIEKMEVQITINPSLLPFKGSDVVITNPPNFTKHIDQTLKQANLPKLKVFKTVIDLSEGYIFLPGKETLGKVINIVRKNGLIEFQRADWPNLEKSFALAVNDYELRLGSINQGFIIILGQVSRIESEKEAVSRLKRYQLIPSDVWWLDANQSRQRLQVEQLSK